MRLIKWHLSTGTQGCDREGEIEVEDNATDDEIDADVREEVFGFVEWCWSEEPQEPTS